MSFDNNQFQVGDRVIAFQSGYLNPTFEGAVGTVLPDSGSPSRVMVQLDRPIMSSTNYAFEPNNLKHLDPAQHQARLLQLEDQKRRMAHADKYL